MEFQVIGPVELENVDMNAASEIVLADLYAIMFPEHTSIAMQNLRETHVLTEGYGYLRSGKKFPDLHWVVFCASHLTGGISNGGIWDGLLGNQPQLVPDVVPLFKFLGFEVEAADFKRVFEPVLSHHANCKNKVVDRDQYFVELQSAEDCLGDDDVDSWEHGFLGEYGSNNPTLKSKIEVAAVAYVVEGLTEV